MSKRIFSNYFLFLLIASAISSIVLANSKDSIVWNKIEKDQYILYYTKSDKSIAGSIDNYLQSGLKQITDFFQQPFLNKFNVYVFPDRRSLDRQWQKDWGDSTFQSQCWMIASGVAHRLDILSPNAWTKEACDHNANDSIETRQVIWHELVHVFHGQYNPDHTFSYIEKLDWLVEGVATFVSGQLDYKRTQRVEQLVSEEKTPATLDDFWKGQEKYGLSGSMIGFIDKRYGRQKLFVLLQQTNRETALKFLGISEIQLLTDWKNSFQ
jgi:hypothetical protein